MKKSVKILISLAVVACLVGGVILASYLVSLNRYQTKVANTTFSNIDASKVANGTYIGEYDVEFIRAKVEVKVEGGRIVSINLLEHYTDKGAAAEGVEQLIVQQQRVDVDAVAGATNSSIVIKKAVDNALSQGLIGG